MPDLSTIADVLAHSGPAEREQIARDIAATRTRLEWLELLADALDARAAKAPSPEPEPRPAPSPSPAPRPIPVPPRPDVPGRGTGLEGHRRRVARHLREHGPLPLAEAADQCGVPRGSIAKVLRSPWFERVDEGRRWVWRLTADGAAALDEEGGATA